MEKFARPGDFCPNPACPDYGKPQGEHQKNIKKFGKTRKGVQRYRCKTCSRTFTATAGTIFYRKRTPEHEILDILTLLAEGSRISSLNRVKGHKEETILTWLSEAAQHAAQVEEVLMADFHVKRGQLDALWVYVQNKGEKKGYTETETSGQFWRSTYLDMDSRLRVARGIAKDETQASIEVFRTLQRRGHPDAPPPTISDGWGGIGQAILEVYGVVPEYQGRGRPPTRKKPGRHWQYVQAIREKDEQGRWIGIRIRVVFGSRQEVLELLGRSTAYVERSHLTSRLFNGRQVRKTLAFSKALKMYRAAAIWEDAYYNLVRPHKSLRIPAPEGSGQRWQPRTPAMAAGLTDHIWTVKELLTTLPLPRFSNT